MIRFVTGHDFGRAESVASSMRALQAGEKRKKQGESRRVVDSGAKAHIHFPALTARLKSCRVTNPLREGVFPQPLLAPAQFRAEIRLSFALFPKPV